MRAGLSTIQQTLTPEAATVLTHSIAEAARRNHGQTTPLHVAATLLSSPNGLLRQACIKSHPNSSHPLQCRALELCFSVALDRLPSNPNPNPPPPPPPQSSDPPLSNALMAALKRAQAHQRRGCPEQQQSPLLAVKVELDQLVVSILDDPSVSRVMKEASFSSPAVKATIEHSLSSTPPLPTPSSNSSLASPAASGIGYGFGSRSSTLRNLYMNPRLQQQQQQQQKESLVAGSGGARGGERKDEVTRVMEVLMRSKKRNAILVGDSDMSPVTKEVIQRLEKRELGDKVRTVISLARELEGIERAQIPAKIRELGSLIEAKVLAPGSDAVVIDLGDLKWLVESNGGLGPKLQQQQQQQQQASSDIARVAVAEMARNFRRFSEILVAGGGRVCALGTASCATYLRCQVYHPTMETEWDLYVVPVAAKAPTLGLFSSLGSNNGILSSSVETLAPPKGFPSIKPPNLSPTLSPPPETGATAAAASQKQALCPQCTESYERELEKLVAEEFEKSSTASRTDQEKSNLPQWLQIATPSITKDHQSKSKEHELNCKKSMEDLLKRWKLTCSRLHSKSITLNPRLCQPKLVNPSLPQGFPPTLQLSSSSNRPESRPGSPVKTDLVLGNAKPPVVSSPLEKAHFERIIGFPGCKQDNSIAATAAVANFEDSDSLKTLFKGLLDKVSWQPDAASAITSAVQQSKSGNGKRRGVMPKADTWLLFAGHDKVGKKKMAGALSELVFGVEPVTVRLGSPGTTQGDGGESNMSFRGRTALDRVAEAVKQNPFSVIVLEDVDQADVVARGTIRRAIERGRLPDSYGREISLGSAIFVLTANWLPDELKCSTDSLLAEEKLLNSANSSWHLELSVGGKRLPDWLAKEDGQSKRRKDSNGSGLSLDLNLNLTVGGNLDDEAGEGSRNSSDLTVEHEHDHGRLAIKQSTFSASEFVEPVDSMVVFQPVDFGALRRRVSESIAGKFAAVIGSGRTVRVDDNVLDRIVGGIWLSGVGFDDWAERVLVPNIERLKGNSMVDGGASVQLRAVDSGQSKLKRVSVAGDWLPDTVTLAGI